tara:strand:- start:612 stop:1748 length:1137 start_codon:yes stop_codon:yes gene_type:complete
MIQVLLSSCGASSNSNSSAEALSLSAENTNFIVNEAVPSFLEFFERSIPIHNDGYQILKSNDQVFNYNKGWLKLECLDDDSENVCAEYMRVYSIKGYQNHVLLTIKELNELSSLHNTRIELVKDSDVYTIELSQTHYYNGLLVLDFYKNKQSYKHNNENSKFVLNIQGHDFFRLYCAQREGLYHCEQLDDYEIPFFFINDIGKISIGSVNYIKGILTVSDSKKVLIPSKVYGIEFDRYTSNWRNSYDSNNGESGNSYTYNYTIEYSKDLKPLTYTEESFENEKLSQTTTTTIDYINKTQTKVVKYLFKNVIYENTSEGEIDFEYDHSFLNNVRTNEMQIKKQVRSFNDGTKNITHYSDGNVIKFVQVLQDGTEVVTYY